MVDSWLRGGGGKEHCIKHSPGPTSICSHKGHKVWYNIKVLMNHRGNGPIVAVMSQLSMYTVFQQLRVCHVRIIRNKIVPGLLIHQCYYKMSAYQLLVSQIIETGFYNLC